MAKPLKSGFMTAFQNFQRAAVQLLEQMDEQERLTMDNRVHPTLPHTITIKRYKVKVR